MLENYVTYLKFLDEKFKRFFERQKPYIFCKRGCGKCCKGAQFPYSQVEMLYLLQGASQLDVETQKIIEENIEKTLEEKKNFKGEKFKYDCPFLINNECSVYEYRGIVCRAFGLMETTESGIIKAPFCYEIGLNYSNVMQEDGKNISVEKFKKLGVKEEPVAFNIGYKFLTDPDFERGFNFTFGDKKPLIEWFSPKSEVMNKTEDDLKS